MDNFFGVFAFIFGAILGSFLNVVIYRYNTGKTFGGRSMCMSCSKKLLWYELVPILSFIFLKGKCSKCSSKISLFYPIVELFTGFAFLLLYNKFSYLFVNHFSSYFLLLVFYSTIISLLIVIAGYDLRHKIIPDGPVIAFIILSIFSIFIKVDNGIFFILPSAPAFVSGILVALPFFLISVLSKGKLMGFADSKLALGIGYLLGISSGFTALVFSFWIGAIVSILLLIFSSQKFRMKSEIPFAPFLVVGALITFFYNLDILSIVSFVSRLHF